ncbi:MAG: FAD-dependent oxidoreductase [Deltaproteobacteria bacterium]|nr:FAD-dependent oxidoreductase [Deltaproteobacteria bacterium]
MAFLGFEHLQFTDLFTRAGLAELQAWFERDLKQADAPLHESYVSYLGGRAVTTPEESALLLKIAPFVERFVTARFQLGGEVHGLADKTRQEDRRFRFKREIVTRRVRMKRKAADFESGGTGELSMLDRALVSYNNNSEATSRDEVAMADLALDVWDVQLPLSQTKAEDALAPDLQNAIGSLRNRLWNARADLKQVGVDIEGEERAWPALLLDLIERGVGWRLWSKAYAAKEWVSQFAPRDVDFDHLVHPPHHLRERPGFALTDRRGTRLEVLDQVHYCIYCHPREKDSCSKGFVQKDGTYKKNPLGVSLEGCPLEEKISETHVLRKDGHSIGALAMVMVDNAMCPGTGHRICNDCMKGCIYQKQSPVNIPLVETHTLTDVLNMPYGVEVYGLLTRWNPLNRRRVFAEDYNGKNVLVVGLGPAGYTLAHHLLNEGFGVVAVDGAKLEPLPPTWIGQPIKDYRMIESELNERPILGFGGVSEYGITVRWDKNFLTLMYLTLQRRQTFKALGGVRFGGSLTIDDAWQLGFDHIAIAAGAGKPTMVEMKNNVIRGVRQASDFLMALQLSGAFKKSALSNLQVRLPGIVIGGGLTAIDTATEMLAYYLVQIERVLERHERLVARLGEQKVYAQYDQEEREIYDEFLRHGRELRSEREAAKREGREAHTIPLLKKWGGVSLAYRKTMKDSPAYRLNHEEIEKALEEGISFLENLTPKESIVDAHGAIEAMVFDKGAEVVKLPVRTLCVAAGTSPNTMYEKEYTGTFALDERKSFFKNFRAVTDAAGKVALEATTDGAGFFTSYIKDNKTVTYYGDNHPKYAGSVVKAMASAKDGYAHVAKLFAPAIAALDRKDQPKRDQQWAAFSASISEQLSATVVRVDRLTSTIVEVIVKAPLAAKKFQPGQFYRLQNYESIADEIEDTSLVMEGLALTGAWVDKEQGLLSMIVLEMGASSRMCARLKPHEPVVVMGPTGTPTEIPHNENVVLVGGGLGNAVLFSIAAALKANGCKVCYIAGYRKGEDLFKQEEIERSTDQVVWCSDTGVEIKPRRPQDRYHRGNIVQGLVALAKSEIGEPIFPFITAKRYIVIGSDRMMAAVARARHEILAKHCSKDHVAIGSINSPMQCMMKEICAQCLQRHVDPATGKERFVFSCYNQDQELDHVDWHHLNTRLRQNSVQEKQTNLWLDHLLAVEQR